MPFLRPSLRALVYGAAPTPLFPAPMVYHAGVFRMTGDATVAVYVVELPDAKLSLSALVETLIATAPPTQVLILLYPPKDRTRPPPGLTSLRQYASRYGGGDWRAAAAPEAGDCALMLTTVAAAPCLTHFLQQVRAERADREEQAARG